MKRCAQKYCRSQSAGTRALCHKHAKQKYRKDNPMKAAYQNLKSNAKRRGKEFTITFEHFKEFCIETDYMVGKGRASTSYHIDRDDETKGYIPGNLKRRTNAENNRKYRRYLKYSKTNGVPDQFWVEDELKTNNDNVPF